MHFSSLILLPCALALPLLSSDQQASTREEDSCTHGAWSCDADTSAFSVCVNGSQMPVGTLPAEVSCGTIFPSTSAAPEKRQESQAEYGQCAGEGYSGPTACSEGWSCQYQNPWYSQCLPGGGSGGGGGGGEGGGEENGGSSEESGGEESGGGGGGEGGQAEHWGQCAGEGWSGPTSCAEGFSCQYQNPWYSQCL